MTTTPARTRKQPPAAPVSPAVAPTTTPPADEPATGPEPAAAGTFAIYESADGGVVLVLDLARGTYTDAGQLPLGEHRLKVPAPIMRMIMSMAGQPGSGGPGKLKSMLMKRLGV